MKVDCSMHYIWLLHCGYASTQTRTPSSFVKSSRSGVQARWLLVGGKGVARHKVLHVRLTAALQHQALVVDGVGTVQHNLGAAVQFRGCSHPVFLSISNFCRISLRLVKHQNYRSYVLDRVIYLRNKTISFLLFFKPTCLVVSNILVGRPMVLF